MRWGRQMLQSMNPAFLSGLQSTEKRKVKIGREIGANWINACPVWADGPWFLSSTREIRRRLGWNFHPVPVCVCACVTRELNIELKARASREKSFPPAGSLGLRLILRSKQKEFFSSYTKPELMAWLQEIRAGRWAELMETNKSGDGEKCVCEGAN